MYIANAEDIINHLYADVDGHKTSREGRKKLNYFYGGHTYGEVTFSGFYKMMELAQPRDGEVFYDLGSGTGKAVMTAALLYGFSKLVGVEIIKDLNDTAHTVLSKFHHDYPQLKRNIHFQAADFTKIDLNDADIIFINSTCLQYEFTLPFLKKLDALEKGTRVLTSTLSIASDAFHVQTIGSIPFSWGNEEVYLHIKN